LQKIYEHVRLDDYWFSDEEIIGESKSSITQEKNSSSSVSPIDVSNAFLSSSSSSDLPSSSSLLSSCVGSTSSLSSPVPSDVFPDGHVSLSPSSPKQSVRSDGSFLGHKRSLSTLEKLEQESKLFGRLRRTSVTKVIHNLKRKYPLLVSFATKLYSSDLEYSSGMKRDSGPEDSIGSS
jgi:hypothetical protein